MPKQTTKPIDYPQAVLQQIEQLAQNIVLARKRRKETQAQWAKRLGVSQPTMARIERGDPSVAMASYVMCMWLIQPDCALADLIAPQNDTIALEREIAKVQPRHTPAASNLTQSRKEYQADKRKENMVGRPIAEKTASDDIPAQTYKTPYPLQGTLALAEAAKTLGYGSIEELARNLDSNHPAKIAAGLAALIAKP